MMTKYLSEDQVKQYWHDGFIAPLPAISADEAAACRDLILNYQTEHNCNVMDVLKMKAHLPFPHLAAVVKAPQILDIIEDLIGPNILIWGTGFFVKPPKSGGWTSWHQDSTYRKYDPSEVVTGWIAFTPSTVENGCVQMIPGTHRQGQLHHDESADDANLLSRGQTIPGVDTDSAQDIVLQPGEMSLHHEMAVHCSRPNNSDEWRIGMTVHYIPPHVKTLGIYDTFGATVARGTDTHGYYQPDPEPRYEMDPVAVAAMDRAWDIYKTADPAVTNAPPPRAFDYD